mmetsp:Transcript_38423/g.69256  ORF Transcript_38423/g.69256 Transcript_38423/m.69256 type:complete len:344 (-) Transcript_38423:101-1132(-)|eukprot:CAMPEP_0201888032 /NCGR_PEP_ID=MMETSP0902-20130614/26487_1 /ASSEMBLY_ACC=CAM_ASM_000551 /TAXON_ID=420261 /ORGANISM="Thalassiosira antarctica, Strain CCMP982" /LENGTH=343 /DNA_ID=CAMNT_0048418161 /DNA_START=200 /DNA_END=1231 /DNA_ORIENTATION=+
MENLTKSGAGEDASCNPGSGISAAAFRESSLSNISAVAADSDVEIPIIDMKAAKEDVAEQMWNAARTVGFFTIVNHGIAERDIDSIFQSSKEFFDQSPSEKRQFPFDRDRNSGYEYMTQAPASTNTVDQKESMQITAREGCMETLWPSNPENFKSDMEHMMTSAHELACTILSLLEAKACPHLKPGTLAKSHHLWNGDGQCTLRLMHYPPIDEKILSTNNLWRAGAHTDWGCITLLFQRMGQDGLECRANPQGDAKWIEVPPVQNGGITVNIGDMLKLWSDSSLFSNMHRVRMPRTVGECKKSRYSVAFFLQANKSALIESRTNDPVTAGEYFAGRISSHFSE